MNKEWGLRGFHMRFGSHAAVDFFEQSVRQAEERDALDRMPGMLVTGWNANGAVLAAALLGDGDLGEDKGNNRLATAGRIGVASANPIQTMEKDTLISSEHRSHHFTHPLGPGMVLALREAPCQTDRAHRRFT